MAKPSANTDPFRPGAPPPEPGEERSRGRVAEFFRSGEWLHHIVAAVLFFVALYFVLWFQLVNRHQWLVFLALVRDYDVLGEFNWRMFAWGAGALLVFAIVGWFFIETLEIYLPRSAVAALSFALGLGLCGVVFEWIAMADLLERPWVFLAPLALLLVFAPFVVRAGRRRPETGEGGEGDPVQLTARREMAAEYFERTLIVPRSLPQRAYQLAVLTLIALISLLVFYHAVLFPETYWDAMILYLGYARMMFLEGGIVRKVVGQVGYGLGANYPHLFELLGAATTVAAGEWSTLPQRMISPLTGLATTVLVYQIALRLTRHVNYSLSVALLYRAIPLAIVYDQYASNYSLAILMTAAFLFVALLYIESALSGYFIIATLLVALAMHINYLMGILWVGWGVMILGAHLFVPTAREIDEAEETRRQALWGRPRYGLPARDEEPEAPPPWTCYRVRRSLVALLRSPRFWVTFVVCVGIASTWYVRNWVVTGNPVYAFFYEIFGGKNINPEVMESAAKEWSANSAGIGRVGETPWERVLNSWMFYVVGPQPWRLQPLFPGFVWAAFFVLLARMTAAVLPGRKRHSLRLRLADEGLRFGAVALVLAAALFAYHYVLAPFYLYQIIIVLPVLAAFLVYVFPYWQRWRIAFGAFVLITGLVPGVAMGLMGFKVFGPVQAGPERVETPMELFAFRHPLPPDNLMWQWRFGDDARMWEFINDHLKGQKILTHENRQLAFDPSIELVHLDDWEIQPLWDLSPAEQIEELKAMGIRYYLKVPNELNHPINLRMGTDHWVALDLVEIQRRNGENILFRLK